MHLRQLALTNFRNYVRLGLNLGPGVTVIVGENAQGKSNLLEAVHVLATTRSLRATTERELVYWRASDEGVAFARLEGRVGRSGAELHVELLIRGDGAGGSGSGPAFSKTIRVNGLPTRAAQLVGQVNVVLFSPEDVGLAAGAPSGRRRYLDITNSQVNPSYLRALQRYKRVLDQRNHLLRQLRGRRTRDQLAPWNDEQVELGSAVLAQRLKMMAGINAVVAERFRQLSGTEQMLEVAYTPTCLPEARRSPMAVAEARAAWSARGPNEVASEVAQAFRERMAEVADRELDQCVSLVGPHRDDFAFCLDGVDLNTYGSRGQQRLAVLALKLAELEFMQAETGERPVLLLDDVLSELDPVRQAFVLERTAGEGQTLITTTDLGELSARFLEQADVLRVTAGSVERLAGAA